MGNTLFSDHRLIGEQLPAYLHVLECALSESGGVKCPAETARVELMSVTLDGGLVT